MSSNRRYETPEEVEAAFYEAFERADLAATMNVWADQDELVCIHPQGPRLVGFDSIRDSFAQIFAAGISLRVRVDHGHHYHSQALAVHCVVEHIEVVGEKSSPPPINSTNVYAYTDDGWRMIAHHASPGEAAGAIENPHLHTLH
jgi:ketosteroid isomerase-like protein